MVSQANSLPKSYQEKLANGLDVVVVPMSKNDVIQVNVIYRVGSRNEILGKSGIAHMLEHMNFKSTKNLKDGQFDAEVTKRGGVNNAYTNFDYTNYYIKSSKDNLDKDLSLFAELMQNLTLKDEEFQPERKVVAEERRWRTDNSPVGYLFWRFFNTAYVYHPYHWTPIGFMQDIQGWSIDDIKDFHQKYYQPQNATVLVVGDVDPKDVFDAVKKNFAQIPNTGDVPVLKAVEPEQDGQRFARVHKDTQLEWLALGYKTPKFDNKDAVALDALGSLLSDGKSSILYKKLVDGKRIANSVEGFNYNLRDSGVFMFVVSGNKGVSADKLKSQVEKIIEEVKAGKISDEDLDKLKLNNKSTFMDSLESVSAVSGVFASYIGKGNLKPLLSYEDDYDGLSVKDLVDVANKYFVKKSETTIYLAK